LDASRQEGQGNPTCPLVQFPVRDFAPFLDYRRAVGEKGSGTFQVFGNIHRKSCHWINGLIFIAIK
jgi:hypothetical protein